MPYPAVPDRRMPYDADGTLVAHADHDFSGGLTDYPSGAQLISLNGCVDPGRIENVAGDYCSLWFFFPGEQREVTAAYLGYEQQPGRTVLIQGSNDTTNGVDGTWETASCTPNAAGTYGQLDAWRSTIFTISFSGPKKNIRIRADASGSGSVAAWHLVHLYGQKAAGQTPDDILFIDSDEGVAEFSAVEDFGDRPLGTTVVRQFKVKNGSAVHTANNINLQCNDADFSISTDGITWVVTINIAALAPGVSSATLYSKNTTPAPGNVLGPRYARITEIVTGGWT